MKVICELHKSCTMNRTCVHAKEHDPMFCGVDEITRKRWYCDELSECVHAERKVICNPTDNEHREER